MAILAFPLRQWVILCLCSLYSTLLAHHKLHIRNFAAESFVFLMRKVSGMFVVWCCIQFEVVFGFNAQYWVFSREGLTRPELAYSMP